MKYTLSSGDGEHKSDRLLPQHLNDLRRSGLNEGTIRESRVRSVTDPTQVRHLLGDYLPLKAARELGPCLAFPFLDARGELATWVPPGSPAGTVPRPFARLKPDNARTRGEKKVKYESPRGSGNRAYLPPGIGPVLTDPTRELILVEGEKKALAGTQHGFPTIGLSGVWNWTLKRGKDPATGRGAGPRELIPDLAAVSWSGRKVTVVFDSDLADKPSVAWARWHLAQVLVGHGAEVRVVDLPDGDGTKWGLDDFLLARGPDAFRELVGGARPPTRPDAGAVTGRRTVALGEDEHRVNAEVTAELARDCAVYQRGGQLVRVITEGAPEGGPPVPHAPRIEPIPVPALRDVISRRVAFVNRTEDGDEPAHPPGWCVTAVAARGEWPGVRPLTGVVSFPVLRPDGTALTAPGYDPRTGLFLHWAGEPLPVPSVPTAAAARAAANELLDAVCDFPFAADMHRAAWLAGLLTPLARPAFDGPAPLFLVDANVRAAGKGLSLEVISQIVTGDPFPVLSYPADPKSGEEELRKKITTLLMYGDRVALFDNLIGGFGDGTLDRALTGTEWKDRVLGGNTQFRAPLAVTFFATGNNVAIRADTARRVCHVRLESPHERPEDRADVKRPHLIKWVRENRTRLLTAALVILRGYFAAGRPNLGLKPWGSFEGWSAVVRNAVAWCGLPDPGLTRVAVQESADETARGLGQLVAALELIDSGRAGKTAAEIVAAAETGSSHSQEVREMVRDAVEMLVGKPDARRLGNRLRHLRKRVIGGKFIDLAGEDAKRVNRWAVFGTEQFGACPTGHAPRAPHPHTPVPRDEHVEHVEHVLAPGAVTGTVSDEELF